MMDFKQRDDDITNAAMEVMLESFGIQDSPMVGSFWYDPVEDEIFGVSSNFADDVPFYYSNQFREKVKTGRRLHQAIWKKEACRGKDKRFSGDYTKVPRGRVFEFYPDKFVVFTGDWIDEYPTCKQQVIDEFQLPQDTEFRKDLHWQIGHGWSDEF